MRVLVTGATGFIGRYVVRALQELGFQSLIASGRRESELRTLDCEYVVYDLNELDEHCYARLGSPDILFHLAWEPLWDYHDLRHIESTLAMNYRFMRAMIGSGVKVVGCTGTCFEYGLQYGPLSEALPTQPKTCYGVAKDGLRQFLECFQQQQAFALRWLRLFFTYGDGQHSRSLIPQIDEAIDQGATEFPMSGGEQLRDYLPVQLLAEYIVKVTLQNEVDGVINVCQGKPTSVLGLVERHMQQRGRRLQLRLGQYPYRDYEPMSFWGDDRRMREALAAYELGKRINPAPTFHRHEYVKQPA